MSLKNFEKQIKIAEKMRVNASIEEHCEFIKEIFFMKCMLKKDILEYDMADGEAEYKDICREHSYYEQIYDYVMSHELKSGMNGEQMLKYSDNLLSIYQGVDELLSEELDECDEMSTRSGNSWDSMNITVNELRTRCAVYSEYANYLLYGQLI